jgi:hypothetical protein
VRFCAWVRKSRSLPLLESRRRQLAYLIYWRDFILEEGAPYSWTVSFLEKFLAIRIQRYQLQSDHSSRTAIPVEGILYLTSQLSSGADLAVERGAHHIWPQIWQYEPDSFTILELLLYQVHYCICITVLDHCSTHIYIIISKLVFPGGVLSRVIDQK